MVTIASVEIQVGADTSPLVQAINRAVNAMSGFSTIGDTVNGVTENLNSTAGRAAKSIETLAMASGTTLVAGLKSARDAQENATSSINRAESSIFKWSEAIKQSESQNSKLIGTNTRVAASFAAYQDRVKRLSVLVAKGELDTLSFGRAQREVQKASNEMSRAVAEESQILRENAQAEQEAARAAEKLASFKVAAQGKIQSFGQSIQNLKSRNMELIQSDRAVNAEVAKLDRTYRAATAVIRDQTKSVEQRARAERLIKGRLGQTNRVIDTSTKKLREHTTASISAARGTNTLGVRATEMAKSVQIALGPLSGVAARITAIAGLANTTTIALAALVSGFIAFGAVVAKALKAGSDFEKEMFVLQQRIRATGQEAKFTADGLNALAVSLGDKTLTNANAARKALAVLVAEASLTEDQLKRAAFAAQDLAALGFGDVESASRRVARALKDPANGLEAFSRAGITFTLVEREIIENFIETGQKGKAVEAVLQKLNKSIGGAGVAAAKGLAGAYDSLIETVTRFIEVQATQSDAVKIVAEGIRQLTDFISDFSSQAAVAGTTAFLLSGAANVLATSIIALVENLNLIIIAFSVLAGAKGLAGLVGRFERIAGSATLFSGTMTLMRKRVRNVGRTIVFATKSVKGFRIALTALTRLLFPLAFAFIAVEIALSALGDSSEKQRRRVVKNLKAIDEEIANLEGGAPSEDQIRRRLDAINEAIKTLDLPAIVEAQNELKRLREAKEEALAKVSTGEGFATEVAALSHEILFAETRFKQLTSTAEEFGETADNLFRQRGSLEGQLSAMQGASREETLKGELAIARKLSEEIATIGKKALQAGAELEALNVGGIGAQRIEKAAQEAQQELDKLEQKILDVAKAEPEKDIQIIRAATLEQAEEKLRALGATGKDLKELIIDAKVSEQLAKLEQTAVKVSQSLQTQVDFQDDLNSAIAMGGVAEADLLEKRQIALAVQAQGVKLEDDLGQKIAANIQLQNSLNRETANARALKALNDELTLEKIRFDIVGKSKEAQEIILAIHEKNVDLQSRGVGLNEEQAKLERQITVELVRQRQATERLVEAQAELTGALNDSVDALTDGFKAALFEGKALKEVIAELEQKLIDIFLDVLVFDPIKEGLSQTFDQLGGGGGIPGILGGIVGEENVGGGLEGVFGPGGIFGGEKPGNDLGLPEGIMASEVLTGLEEATKLTTEQMDLLTSTLGEGTVEQLLAIAGKSTENAEVIKAVGSKIAENTAVSNTTAAMIALTSQAELAAIALSNIAATSGTGGGGGGVLGSLVGSFVGGGPGGIPGGGPGAAFSPAGFVSGFGFTGARAAGGPVNSGRSFLVGEAGPEIFTPTSSGRITPNDEIGMGKRFSITQNFNMTTEAQNTQAFNSDQLATQAMSRVSSVTKRGLA